MEAVEVENHPLRLAAWSIRRWGSSKLGKNDPDRNLGIFNSTSSA